MVALLAEGGDRNTSSDLPGLKPLMSPSSRRAGIEIRSYSHAPCCPPVALLAEGGDRNLRAELGIDAVEVALLAEGGDRNLWFWGMKNADEVALLAEGGDRNTKSFEEHGYVIGSPSSRRAGIEMKTIKNDSGSRDSRPPRGGRG